VFLEQAIQSPLVVTVGGERWSVPKMTTADYVVWQQAEDAAKADLAAGNLNVENRFQLISWYGVMPTTLEHLFHRVTTPRGAQFIPDHCLRRAVVIERDGQPIDPPEAVAAERLRDVLATITPESRLALALALTDAEDRQAKAAERRKAEADKAKADEGDGARPLTPTPRPASAA
jgi:hypothetical protein